MAPESSTPAPQKLKFEPLIHFYVAVSLLSLGAATFLWVGLSTYEGNNEIAAWIGGASAVVVFAAVLGLVGKYCGSNAISYWDGIRLVSAYLTIGVGGTSLFFSLVGIAVTIVLTFALTIAGIATNNRAMAQNGFVQIVRKIGSYRMYQ